MVSAWNRMTFAFEIWQLATPKICRMWQCDVRQRYRAAPMAHDPLINTLGLCNRLDFNQQAGGRCHLLPSVANRVEAPSLKRCLHGFSMALQWLRNGFALMVSTWLGICNVSCYTYMNVSNDCHSAKTIGQFCIAHGFAMASHWF